MLIRLVLAGLALIAVVLDGLACLALIRGVPIW